MKFFNNKNNSEEKGDDVAPNKDQVIKDIKALAPKANEAFINVQKAFQDFERFLAEDPHASETAVNLFQTTSTDCKVNFTVISLTLEETFLEDEGDESDMLQDLHLNLTQLTTHLQAFKANDPDGLRKTTYQDAIDLVAKIGGLCETILPLVLPTILDRKVAEFILNSFL